MARKPTLIPEAEFQRIVKEYNRKPPFLRSLQLALKIANQLKAMQQQAKPSRKRKPFDGAGTS